MAVTGRQRLSDHTGSFDSTQPPAGSAVHNELHRQEQACDVAPPSHYVSLWRRRGELIMCAALERSKLTFILNRQPQPQSSTTSTSGGSTGTAAAALTISSPLESQQVQSAHSLTGHVWMWAIDNPLFVALEVDYTARTRTAP